jgi:hypothetical protein
MQYKIPQDVQRPDTIIGPITFAQLGICLVGGSFSYVIYIALAKTYYWYIWGPPVAIITLTTLAFAFLKVRDMTFTRFLLYFFEYTTKPKDRFWKKNDFDYYFSITKTPINTNKAEAIDKDTEAQSLEKRKKLKEISKILDQ